MDSLEIRRSRPAQSNTNHPLRETASQTAGPYVHIGCLPEQTGISGVFDKPLSPNPDLSGLPSITITGRIFDGNGDVCKDAMLEFWHADLEGKFEPGIWHRTGTDLETGEYEIKTVLPGRIRLENGTNLAPFSNIWIVARGINTGLQTRVYFPDFNTSNQSDPHLLLVEENRRHTLIAKARDTANSFVFDIVLQGTDETVFFDM